MKITLNPLICFLTTDKSILPTHNIHRKTLELLIGHFMLHDTLNAPNANGTSVVGPTIGKMKRKTIFRTEFPTSVWVNGRQAIVHFHVSCMQCTVHRENGKDLVLLNSKHLHCTFCAFNSIDRKSKQELEREKEKDNQIPDTYLCF